MGTWGVGTFENDDAADWVYHLEKSRDLTLLGSTINALTEATGYLEAPTCVNALAAAEVVAALAGKPASDLPEDVMRWVKSNEKLDAKDLRPPAVSAIDRILADSELKELWGESGEVGNWEAAVRDLRGRLSA